jgi:hypothetical protein
MLSPVPFQCCVIPESAGIRCAMVELEKVIGRQPGHFETLDSNNCAPVSCHSARQCGSR